MFMILIEYSFGEICIFDWEEIYKIYSPEIYISMIKVT